MIMSAFFRYLLLILLLGGVLACSRNPAGEQQPDRAAIRESLARANKLMISAEDQEIRDFVDRYGWQVQETGSGLRYWIYQQGQGEKARAGQIAVIHFQIHLLTGDLVYSSHENKPREFRIGRGGVESGLEEAILLMKQGDRAKFIMPPHLAHGLPGDGVKIPKRASIVYDVELKELNNH